MLDCAAIKTEERLLATHMNNEGVRNLEICQYHKAVECFREALTKFTLAVQEAQKQHEASKSTSQTTFPDTLKPETDCHWSSNPFQTDSQECPDVNENIFVYRRGIYILPHLGQEENINSSRPNTFTTESAAVVYNLGLAYHLLGENNKEDQSQNFRKAMQFYNIAASIRKQRLGCPADLIDIAILNNLGQIHHEFANYDLSRACFDQLAKGLTYFHQCGVLEHCVCQCDQDGFMMNVMMKSPDIAAAA